MKKIFIMTILIAAIAVEANAATFAIDPTYSVVIHKIKHLMGYNVGVFEDVSGTITLDDKNEKVTAVDATVDINSINTRIAKRDEDLLSERFFDAAQYPQGTFKSTKVTKNKITGELTLKGVTKKVTFDYTWAGVGQDQYGNTKMALSAKTTIDRTDFGISHNQKTTDNKILLGDDVELSIEIQGKKVP